MASVRKDLAAELRRSLRGATKTSVVKPKTPPVGPSGVSPSPDGSR